MRVFTTSLVLLISSSKIAFAAYCVFCDPTLMEKESVFETELFRVIVDYEPRVKGHLLAIPKRHMPKAHLMSKEEWEELSIVIPKVAQVFTDFLGTDQYILLEKNGPRAFQDIPHVHFHLLPIHTETWKEIFDVVPKRMTNEEDEKAVKQFRDFFSKTP